MRAWTTHNSNNENMKVKDLIQQLQKLDQERDIYMLGCDNAAEPAFVKLCVDTATQHNLNEYDIFDVGIKEGDYYISEDY